MNHTPKIDPVEFERFLFEEIDLDDYRYRFLNNYIKKAVNGQADINVLSVINTTENGWIIILHGEMLLVYGENWDDSQIEEISQVFDLNIYTNYTITGDNLLIDKLIDYYKPQNHIIEKRRLFYWADEINNYNHQEIQIRLGEAKYLEELAAMLKDYYHYEYNGLNEKTTEEMRKRVLSLINEEKIYIALDNDETLLSFCTINDPDIGILFTKEEARNKGYGKIILSYCAELLHQKNEIVYLMTDRDRIESNTVCEAVGFKPYYDYVSAKINCG
ncbi:MAG TPA: GNAT family N-acetyltransferase [Williamwhitmania sp.]|nr:GNAT family N-acetyltransferase [Williamwhitmania sp.]